MSNKEFQKLLIGIRRGDPSAEEELVKAFDLPLRGVVRRYLSSELRRGQDSADVCQAVWEKIAELHVPDRFTNPGQFFKFLLKCALNHIRDAARKTRHAELKDEEESALEDSGSSPSQRVALKDALEVLRARLPSEYLQTLDWRVVERLSWGDIHARMGRNPAAGRAFEVRYNRDIWKALRELGLEDR